MTQALRRPRHKSHGASGNHERWLITYSDLITLLMIFFVIMYAMSKLDVAKFMTLQQSLAAALHQDREIPLKNLGKTGLVVPANPADTGDKAHTGSSDLPHDQQLDNLYNEMKAYIEQHHLQDKVSVANEPRGVRITLRDVVLFDTGQAVIKPQAQELLKGLVPFLQKLGNAIVVEGYTDNQPISTPQFPSNWELSAARAIGVVHFLAASGVQPDRLSGVGYGEYHPVAPNDTEAHRQMNRRVNIVILRPDANATVDTSGASNAANASNTTGANATRASNAAGAGPAAGNGSSAGK
ncbi:flagellar motor protein MotB [Alicyclobacillus macrosporangiidus]|uniref:Chemotaxis protein MotB n=1 Tax=Alicyclobacillus macrosporangiidus TaxID=392015 RepID=A0A1I7K1C2_9BACL|nr:flagellar motor protein MotB [Alicyclobacillus macrosporangiidus]SFU91179.1 chemotaxis protein MotB [Alicyclobacillus macrosporangiidus]